MTSVGSTTSASSGPAVLGAAPPKSQRQQLPDAAKQFEANFVRQMLAAARKTNFDKDGLFSSQAMDTFNQMQDEKFADTTAQTGMLGLAKIIEAQLARNLPKDQ
jgi:flagellar protein FlgJ